MKLKIEPADLTFDEAESYVEKEHQANSRDLFILVCILTLCIFVLGNLYRSYEKTQNHFGAEVSTAIGANQKAEPKHAPEIGY